MVAAVFSIATPPPPPPPPPTFRITKALLLYRTNAQANTWKAYNHRIIPSHAISSISNRLLHSQAPPPLTTTCNTTTTTTSLWSLVQTLTLNLHRHFLHARDAHKTLSRALLFLYLSLCTGPNNRPPVGDELCVHLWYDSANHPSAGQDPYDWPEVVQPELWEPDANSDAHHFLSALNSGANLFYVSIELAEILLVKKLSFYVPSAWIEFLIFVKSFALLLWMIPSQHSPGFPDFSLH